MVLFLLLFSLLQSAAQAQVLLAPPAPRGRTDYLHFTRNDKILLTGSLQGGLECWDLSSRTALGWLPVHGLTGFALGSDEASAAVAGYGEKLWVVSVPGLKVLRAWSSGRKPGGKPLAGFQIGLSPDKLRLITTASGPAAQLDRDPADRIWNVATGKIVATLPGGSVDRGFAEDFSERSEPVLVTRTKGVLRLVDWNGRPRAKLAADVNLGPTAFNRRRDRIADVSKDGVAYVWSLPEGRLLARHILGEPEMSARFFDEVLVANRDFWEGSFLMDGTRFPGEIVYVDAACIVVDRDQLQTVYDRQGKRLRDLPKPKGLGSYSHGYRIDYDPLHGQKAELWDLHTGKKVWTGGSRVKNAAFSHDGKTIVLAEADGSYWLAQTDSLVHKRLHSTLQLAPWRHSCGSARYPPQVYCWLRARG